MFPRSSQTKKKVVSKSERANVLFPVGRIHRLMKEGCHKFRIGIGAAVYIASVIEYLSAELLELAGNTAKEIRKMRITPRHLLFAIANDRELHDLLRGVTIASGGVIPFIHPNLIQKKPSAITVLQKGLKVNILNKKAIHARQGGIYTRKVAKIGGKKGSKRGSVAANKVSFGVLSEKKLFLGQTLKVVQTDITDIKVDAIVHPTSSSFPMVGQVGQALGAAGGKKLLTEVADLRKTVSLIDCDVAVTGAGKLPSSWIIHVNGPNHNDLNAYDKLETSVKNCLALADSKGMKSIALPSIGSGRGGFPKQPAAQHILKAIQQYFTSAMASSLKEVYFVLYDPQSIKIYTTEMAKLQ